MTVIDSTETNNEAARKSRQRRQAHERDVEEFAASLGQQNESLKRRADVLEELITKLKEALLRGCC
jgi:uncharacterized protein YaaN involved in tellurite resistance